MSEADHEEIIVFICLFLHGGKKKISGNNFLGVFHTQKKYIQAASIQYLIKFYLIIPNKEGSE